MIADYSEEEKKMGKLKILFHINIYVCNLSRKYFDLIIFFSIKKLGVWYFNQLINKTLLSYIFIWGVYICIFLSDWRFCCAVHFSLYYFFHQFIDLFKYCYIICFVLQCIYKYTFISFIDVFVCNHVFFIYFLLRRVTKRR